MVAARIDVSKKVIFKVAYLCNFNINFVSLTFKMREKKQDGGGGALKKYRNYINLDLIYINKKNIGVG